MLKIILLLSIIRTLFLHVPSPFPLWESFGELFWEIALAYSGAWFFNLLVIEGPRRRERRKVYATSLRHVRAIATSGDYLRRRIYAEACHEDPGPRPEQRNLQLAMLKLSIDGQQSNSETMISTDGQTRKSTWGESILGTVKGIDELLSRLEPVYSFYDAEMIQLI